MKKSTLVKSFSIVGTVVLAAIGIILMVLNFMGADGKLANWSYSPWLIFVAYGIFFGPIVLAIAYSCLSHGMQKSNHLHNLEDEAERQKETEKAIRYAQNVYLKDAMDDLLACHPNLKN